MTEFADRLADLQDGGSTLLVTGSSADNAHTEMCRQLLASDSVQPRRRIVVAPNGTLPTGPQLPTDHGTVPDTTVITTPSGRGSSSTATSPLPDGVTTVEADDDSLCAVGLAVVDATRRVERRHGPLEPTELRVGIDSLSPLLDAHGERRVFSFLVVLNRYLRTVDALGHCHLPAPHRSHIARELAPLFDGVVEVRARYDHPQQRWHLDDGDTTSPWLSI